MEHRAGKLQDETPGTAPATAERQAAPLGAAKRSAGHGQEHSGEPPDSQQAPGNGSQNGGRQRPRETGLQIIVTWLSGLLLLAVVGYLVWEGTRPFTPATFDATVERVMFVDGRYHVHLRVTNDGGQSVQSLEVVLVLREGEETVESSTAVLDWLPESSSRSLVLITRHDPTRYLPTVVFEGYQIP